MCAYCENNPCRFSDSGGELLEEAFIFIAGSAIVGAALGALDAACTGGDIFEGAASGFLTGAVSATCVFASAITGTPALATAALSGGLSTLINAGVQYAFHGEVDPLSAVESGITSAAGALFPVFPGLTNNCVDAFGSWLTGSEFGTLVTISHIMIKHLVNNTNTPQNHSQTTGRQYSKNKNVEALY